MRLIPAARFRTPQPQFVWVSEVVVVTGAGTVVCSDVVVVLCVGVEAQALSDAIAMATRLGMISFLMGMVFVWIVALHRMVAATRVGIIWGIDRRLAKRAFADDDPAPTL